MGDLAMTQVLSEMAVKNAGAATRASALQELPIRLQLKPFEPDARIRWALERGLMVALGPDGWRRVEEALPGPASLADLTAGVVSGVGLAVKDVVADRVRLVWDGVTAVLDFYSFVYDGNVWAELLKVWLAPRGTGIEEFAAFLKTEYPDLYTAITAYGRLARTLNDLLGPLIDQESKASMPWSVALEAIAGWVGDLPVTLGQMLRPSVEALIANKGQAWVQGQLIGRVVARVIIEAVLLVMDLYALARGAAGMAKDVFVGLREVLTSDEVGKVIVRAERAAPGVTAAGQDVARANHAAQQIYEDLATEITAYKVLNRKTQAFNRKVRDIVGLKLADREYVGIRLDAQHIIENRWYTKFAKDLEKAFGWKSAEEMDAIALHTEWHIRSGAKLSTNLNLRGAERERSLTKALQDYLRNAQTAPDGTLRPFTTLKQVFEAHAAFYKSYSPRLWPRLERWFSDSMAKLAS